MCFSAANFRAQQRPQREGGPSGATTLSALFRRLRSSQNERKLPIQGSAPFPLSASNCPEAALYQLLSAHTGASGARGDLAQWVGCHGLLPSLLASLRVISSSRD